MVSSNRNGKLLLYGTCIEGLLCIEHFYSHFYLYSLILILQLYEESTIIILTHE